MRGLELYARRRLKLLEALAYAADDPLVAVIGPATGDELIALAKGVRRHHPLRKGSAAGSVVCFHGRRTSGRMHESQQAIVAYANEQTKKRRRLHTSTPVALVVRFVVAEDAERGRWQAEVARLQRAGPLRFGLICHMGWRQGDAKSAERRDLDLFVPMMSERTTLVLCGLEKAAPRRLLRSLVRTGGWSGLWRQSLNLAELGRLPFAV